MAGKELHHYLLTGDREAIEAAVKALWKAKVIGIVGTDLRSGPQAATTGAATLRMMHRLPSDDLAAGIMAERERCAKVAEQTGRLHPLFADQILQQAIAAKIREGA